MLAEADAKLAEEDSSGFLGRLRTQYDELAAAISDAAGILDTASTAADVMPVMLGADEPRSYLLVFQNNAEARASGGLPGSAAVLTADEGRLSLERQFAGAAFGARDEPILPLTSAELQLYGPLLGTDFRDANFTPDFARAAELWSARWEEEFPADTLDGVATLDTVALSYLMRGMDPLEVQGVTLTADNVVEELLAEVYERFEQPALQDAFFQEVATTVFTEAVGGGVAPRELLPALRDAADEGRALVTVDDPVVLERLGDAQILGPDLEGERDAETAEQEADEGERRDQRDADRLFLFLGQDRHDDEAERRHHRRAQQQPQQDRPVGRPHEDAGKGSGGGKNRQGEVQRHLLGGGQDHFAHGLIPASRCRCRRSCRRPSRG